MIALMTIKILKDEWAITCAENNWDLHAYPYSVQPNNRSQMKTPDLDTYLIREIGFYMNNDQNCLYDTETFTVLLNYCQGYTSIYNRGKRTEKKLLQLPGINKNLTDEDIKTYLIFA